MGDWILLVTSRTDPPGLVRVRALADRSTSGRLTDDLRRARVYPSREAAEADAHRVRTGWCATAVPALGPLGPLSPGPLDRDAG